MDIFLTIIAVVVIFSVLVLIHELGHFIAARRAGIKVLEFGIGFPPRLFKKKKGDTLYTINAIPFGGFVKLFGEDAEDPAVLKDPRSFAHKSPWVRTKVIVAGVLMNLLLAIFLLTVGFGFGIEPLLVDEQDLLTNIQKGVVQISPGIFVGKVSDEIKALGMDSGDQIISINDNPIRDESELKIFEKGNAKNDIDVTLLKATDNSAKKIHIPVLQNGSFGIQLKPFTRFPRMEVLEVREGSMSDKAGIIRGDVILQMNDTDIYSAADVAAISEANSSIKYKILRGNWLLDMTIPSQDNRKVILANIFPNTSAEKAGFKRGDSVLAIDGVAVNTPLEVQDILKQGIGKEMTYKVLRNGESLEIKATTGENNILGVELSSLASFQNNDLSFFRSTILTSITNIGKVRYGPLQSLKQAVSESVRLTGLTVSAFGKTVSSIVSRFQVPGDVGGPVQIAYYTHAFVQEGFFALLRFMALLSLSLAVINILPIPALDGGRFLFIVLEVIFRKRISARTEALVHGIGFIILMGFIILITYSDITKLF